MPLPKAFVATALLAAFSSSIRAEPLQGEPGTPYIGLFGGANTGLRSTDAFPGKTQWNAQVVTAVPVDAATSFEVNVFYHEGRGLPNAKGVGLDLALRDPDGTPGILLLAGFGTQRRGDKDALLPFANIGFGSVLPLNSRLRLRTEARLYATRETTLTAGRDLLFEARAGVGLEIAYLQPFPVEPVVACGTACAPVSPVTSLDSDFDGVADEVDRCPASPPDTSVGADGCALVTAPVPPAPRVPIKVVDPLCDEVKLPSLKFDEVSCLIPQDADIAEIQFESDGTKLSADGALAVDDLARALKGRPNLNIEVISHAQVSDEKAHNLTLSERRAQLIRDRLVGRGVAATRITASTAAEEAARTGSESPAADQSRNDRIELRITNGTVKTD